MVRGLIFLVAISAVYACKTPSPNVRVGRTGFISNRDLVSVGGTENWGWQEQVEWVIKEKDCYRSLKPIMLSLNSLRTHFDRTQPCGTIPCRLSQMAFKRCQGPYLLKTNRLLHQYENESSGKIGVILPFSGDYAEIANSVARGILSSLKELVRDTNNSIIEFNKMNKIFVFRDSLGTPEGTKRALAQLIFKENVSLILGGLGESEARNMVPHARRLGLPMIILNKNKRIVREWPATFQMYPNHQDFSLGLAKVVKSRNYSSVSIFRPKSGKSDQLIQSFVSNLKLLGIKVDSVLTYISGEYESMNHATKTIARTSPQDRPYEYQQLYLDAEKQAQMSGSALDPRRVILPPDVQTDAVFIPDSSRIVRFFIKLFRYHRVVKIPLIGNAEWRSPTLVHPWDNFIEDGFFVDFIGRYQDLPFDPIPQTSHFSSGLLSSKDARDVDFQYIGYRAAIVAMHVINTTVIKRNLVKALSLMKQKTPKGLMPLFHNDRTSHWPVFIFGVGQTGIKLLSDA